MRQRMGNNNGHQPPETHEKVVDFTARREQKLEQKRRQNERIFFKNLLNVYSVIDQAQPRAIELIDVSEGGCAFQIPYDATDPWPKDHPTLPLRLYFSADTYLEILVQIQYSRPSIENNRRFVRFGCKVDESTQSYPVFQQFVRFLKLYTEQARKDRGDVTVFYP